MPDIKKSSHPGNFGTIREWVELGIIVGLVLLAVMIVFYLQFSFVS